MTASAHVYFVKQGNSNLDKRSPDGQLCCQYKLKYCSSHAPRMSALVSCRGGSVFVIIDNDLEEPLGWCDRDDVFTAPAAFPLVVAEFFFEKP